MLFGRIFKSARGVVALLPPSEWSLLPLYLVLLSKCTLVGEIYYDLKSETNSFSRAGFCSDAAATGVPPHHVHGEHTIFPTQLVFILAFMRQRLFLFCNTTTTHKIKVHHLYLQLSSFWSIQSRKERTIVGLWLGP